MSGTVVGLEWIEGSPWMEGTPSLPLTCSYRDWSSSCPAWMPHVEGGRAPWSPLIVDGAAASRMAARSLSVLPAGPHQVTIWWLRGKDGIQLAAMTWTAGSGARPNFPFRPEDLRSPDWLDVRELPLAAVLEVMES